MTTGIEWTPPWILEAREALKAAHAALKVAREQGDQATIKRAEKDVSYARDRLVIMGDSELGS
jgi:hypothetical protein